uniref:Cytosolic adenylate kinase 2 n=1 Tax=Mastigamoeba balamuthi TaxID=108607 RepID=A0A0B4R3D0_MASBA|nr:cytosolic adenylate kinase 2 [Mastigamoeba balamuthi]|eukprot:m51a1_g10748 putative adenylate kinase 7 (604) ;mRNA; r:354734-357247
MSESDDVVARSVYLHDPESYLGAALRKAFAPPAQAEIIVFDARSEWEMPKNALQELEKKMEDGRPKTVFLVTTVMTWAATPTDPEDPELPFAEEDFRKRKPHPNYRKQMFLEKYALKLTRPGLSVFVVATGLLYGAGEDVLHYLFKCAWHGQPSELPCIGKAGEGLGVNIVPTIHVQDFCSVIMQLLKRMPEDHYVLAADLGNNTLHDIVQAISTSIGTGKIKAMSPEEALVTDGLTQRDIDLLQVNLRIESLVVKDLAIPWVAETGLVENIALAAKEYREARGLTPIRIVVLGPPASGKTALSEAIAAKYTIHRVCAQDAVAKALAADKELAERRDPVTGRLADDDLSGAFAARLTGWQCQNQGYVLDGFPKTSPHLKLLYGGGHDAAGNGGGDGDEDAPAHSPVPPPEHVFVLDAEDAALRARVMASRDGDEERFERRLKDYRTNCTPDAGPAAGFEALGVLPIPLDATQPVDTLLQLVAREVGAPHRYGPSAEEIEEQRRAVERAAREAAQREEAERLARESSEREKRAAAVAAWDARLGELRSHERELLKARSQPFRQYLMDSVMPTLSRALVELAEVRPGDPVDYLAEFLLKAALQQS